MFLKRPYLILTAVLVIILTAWMVRLVMPRSFSLGDLMKDVRAAQTKMVSIDGPQQKLSFHSDQKQVDFVYDDASHRLLKKVNGRTVAKMGQITGFQVGWFDNSRGILVMDMIMRGQNVHFKIKLTDTQ